MRNVDAVHDQADPRALLRGIRRALADGGVSNDPSPDDLGITRAEVSYNLGHIHARLGEIRPL